MNDALPQGYRCGTEIAIALILSDFVCILDQQLVGGDRYGQKRATAALNRAVAPRLTCRSRDGSYELETMLMRNVLVAALSHL